MKEFVMWGSVACLGIGIPMFFVGRFIEKGQRLMKVMKGTESRSKLGDRLFWCGTGLFVIGLLLMLFVYPKL